MAAGLNSTMIARRYLLADVLGKGGMGVVYRAVDRLSGQEVALKRVLTEPQVADGSTNSNAMDFRMALAQEFKLSASLRHPNIIEVLDYGFDEESQPFFTMEILPSPQDLLQYGVPRSIDNRIDLLVQMLYAIAYLHRRGIVHRDLKPANVLVSEGRVKVLDFGLSVMHERSQNTDTVETEALTAGTLAYISPEVLLGSPATEASDLYAIGMIAYELFAGHHPFNIENPAELLNQTLYNLPNVNELDVSDELRCIILRLLQKEPADRYANALHAIEALDQATSKPLPLETSAIRESFLKAARLVGRDSELHQLSDGLVSAAKGRGSAWLIAGESGVGKSRIIDELRTIALVRGVQVMRGQASSVGGRPYEMWLPIFRWICLLEDDFSDEEIALLKAFIPDMGKLIQRSIDHIQEEKLRPEEMQTRLVSLLDQVLRRQKRPILILFEDLHWTGSESLAVLARLSEIIHETTVMVVAAYRDDERPDLYTHLPSMPLLKLGRLPQDSIAELSEAMLGVSGKLPEVVHLLHRETEGNVFFLIEVVRALAEEAGQLDQIGRMTLPERVFAGGMKTVIQRRLNRIDPSGQTLLRLAAAMGRQLDLRLLQRMEPRIDYENWLSDCANAAVLEVDDGQWRFAHDKLRVGVLDDLPPEDRRQLHRRVAEAIETHYGENPAQISALAHHWKNAEDGAKEEYYITLAAQQDLVNGAYREALGHFQRALKLNTLSAVEEAEKRRKEMRLKEQMGRAYLGLGEYSKANDLFDECLTLAKQEKDQNATARALCLLGEVAQAFSNLEVAKDFYQRSNLLYREINDISGISQTLNFLGDIADEMGDSETAKQLYKESLSLAREAGERWGMAGAIRTQELIGVGNADVYDETRSGVLAQLAVHMAKEDFPAAAAALYDLGNMSAEAGDYPGARSYFEQCIDLRRNIGDKPGLSAALARLAGLFIENEPTANIAEPLNEALKTAQDANDTQQSLRILLLFARWMSATNDLAPRAIEIAAFLIYYPDSQDTTQDAAERLVMELENGLEPAQLSQSWENGKNKSFETLVAEVLAR